MLLGGRWAGCWGLEREGGLRGEGAPAERWMGVLGWEVGLLVGICGGLAGRETTTSASTSADAVDGVSRGWRRRDVGIVRQTGRQVGKGSVEFDGVE